MGNGHFIKKMAQYTKSKNTNFKYLNYILKSKPHNRGVFVCGMMYKFFIANILFTGIILSQGVLMEKIKANNLEFDVRAAGLSNNGDAVILLHGFPETSHMYKDLIILLSDNNYKVIAPDQRGYSIGARPKSRNNYKIEYLVEDLFSLADVFNFEKFHLVGHDWGASIGWAAVSVEPNRIITWTPMSVPHLDAFAQVLDHDNDQKQMSRYISFFKLPFIPELFFSMNDYKNLISIWTESSNEEKEEYLKVFRQKDAIKSSLNWYRENVSIKNRKERSIGNISTTTQFIWGNNDIALGRKGAELTEKYMKGNYNFVELDLGHWLIQEDYDTVSSLILNFIKENSTK